jgi:hypothetical protein
MNFSIAEDGHSLEFNGNSIFPLQIVHENLSKAYVKQVASSATLDEIKTGDVKYTPLEVTASGVVVEHEEIITPQGDILIPVRHTIFELEGQSVSVDTVAINLLKTTAGELYILHVETMEREPPRPDDSFSPSHGDLLDFPAPPPPRHMGQSPPPHPVAGSDRECKVLPPALCRLRSMIEAKITDLQHGGMRHGGMRHGDMKHGGKMPCPGFKVKGGPSRFFHGSSGSPHHSYSDFAQDAPLPFSHGRPHHPRPYHGHHHHRHHSFFESLGRGFAAVMVPTLAGIAVGMLVSLIGLVVGRIIGYLWIKLYRGSRRGYASVALDDSSVEAADAEKTLDEAEDEKYDDLPAYECPPAYADEISSHEGK